VSGFVRSSVLLTVDWVTQQLSARAPNFGWLEWIRWGSSVHTICESEGWLWTTFTQWTLGLHAAIVSVVQSCPKDQKLFQNFLLPSKDRRVLGACLEQSFQFSFIWSKGSCCAQMPLGEPNQESDKWGQPRNSLKNLTTFPNWNVTLDTGSEDHCWDSWLRVSTFSS